MIFRMSDDEMAQQVNTSRKILIEAIDTFCHGKQKSLTIHSLIQSVVLYNKEELIKLYENSAVQVLRQREKEGLIYHEKTGKEATYFRKEQTKTDKTVAIDVQLLYKQNLPALKEGLMHYLRTAAGSSLLSVNAVFIALDIPCSNQPGVGKLYKKYISIRFCKLAKGGYLASAESSGSKFYYRTGKSFKS